ncbi:hypothetical protein [Candidatus Entotheonella palauensis]|nr:hypothetical protein [Candidatus Entotheonella palauensis]
MFRNLFLANIEEAWRGIWPYLGVALLAGAKFFAGLVAALLQQFNLLEMLLTVGIGGCVGVWVYTYLGQALYRLISHRLSPYWPWQRQRHSARRYAIIQRVWHRYGLAGVAALLPLLSPQISIGLALSLGEKPQRILFYMVLSVMAWTLLSSGLRDTTLALVGG